MELFSDLFNLPGPQFLVVYIAIGIVVLLGLAWHRHAHEEGPATKLRMTDPYLIAYLRGGENEARRVAVVSLIDRGLLQVISSESGWLFTTKEFKLLTGSPTARDMVTQPLEKALLQKFATAKDPTAIFNDLTLQAADRAYEGELKKLGLYPDTATQAARLQRFIVALIALLSVAIIKIGIALRHGHQNILFLIVLAIMFSSFAMRYGFPSRTRRGDVALEDLQTLFAGLKARASSLRPGKSLDEVTLLAAVFGIGTLPEEHFSYVKDLYKKATSSSSSRSNPSCGSSCGSSCGGGGCGGGCGGCGG